MKHVFFSIADNNNIEYARMMIKSLRHYHPTSPVVLFAQRGAGEHFKGLNIEVRETLDNNKDPHFFYRATPILAKELIEEYELVVKLDSDQLILGDLDHIINSEYEVGTVLNINRVDPPTYGLVQAQGIGANEYFNCGLVAMRSKKFIEHWYNLCFSKYFERMQYREQDLLNILAHYGDYKVVCFDSQKEPMFNGLVAKGEAVHAKVKDGKLIIPKGKDGYPDRDTVVKVFHWGGGGNEAKMNFRAHFSDEGIKYIEDILK